MSIPEDGSKHFLELTEIELELIQTSKFEWRK